MRKLLTYGLPAALGLLLASPAMAQNSGYNNGSQLGTGNWQNSNGQAWMGPNSPTTSHFRDSSNYRSNGPNENNTNSSSNGWNNGQNGYNGQNTAGNGSNSGWNGNANEQAVSQGFVAHLQRRLQQEGMYNGNIDGIWGRNTQTALQNFQQQHNMRGSGQINMQTLEALDMLNGNGGQYGQNSNTYGNSQNGQSSQYGENGNYQTYNRGSNPGQSYTSNNNGGSNGSGSNSYGSSSYGNNFGNNGNNGNNGGSSYNGSNNNGSPTR